MTYTLSNARGPFHIIEIHQTYDPSSDLDYRTYRTYRTIRTLSNDEELREYMISYLKHYYHKSNRNIEKLINNIETNSIEKIISFWIRRGLSLIERGKLEYGRKFCIDIFEGFHIDNEDKLDNEEESWLD